WNSSFVIVDAKIIHIRRWVTAHCRPSVTYRLSPIAYRLFLYSRPFLDSKEALRRGRTIRVVEAKLAVCQNLWIGQFDPTAQSQRQVSRGEYVNSGRAIGVERRTVFSADGEFERPRATGQGWSQFQRRGRRGNGSYIETDGFRC